MNEPAGILRYDYIKTDIREVTCKGVEWMEPALDAV
jgi:hypothetical protein